MVTKKSLATKIQKNFLIGIIVLFALTLGSLYIGFNFLLQKKIQENLEREKLALGDYLKEQAKKSLSEVLAIATNNKVKEVYAHLKKEVGDLSKVSDNNKEIFIKYGKILREEVEPYISSVEKATGKRMKIHFHLPGPRSFLRTFRKPGEDIKLDDLSGFRFAVAKA